MRLPVCPMDEVRRLDLFRWCDLLEDALAAGESPGAQPTPIIVHSNWRRCTWATNDFLRSALGRLGHRFAGVTPSDMHRQDSIEHVCSRLGITSRLILDDSPREFLPGTAGLLLTNPLTGVNDPAVLGQVSAWARSLSPRAVRCPAEADRLRACAA